MVGTLRLRVTDKFVAGGLPQILGKTLPGGTIFAPQHLDTRDPRQGRTTSVPVFAGCATHDRPTRSHIGRSPADECAPTAYARLGILLPPVVRSGRTNFAAVIPLGKPGASSSRFWALQLSHGTDSGFSVVLKRPKPFISYYPEDRLLDSGVSIQFDGSTGRVSTPVPTRRESLGVTSEKHLLGDRPTSLTPSMVQSLIAAVVLSPGTGGWGSV